MAAAHLIYAEAMSDLTHGYPLWEPDCEVSIADVGFIKDGYFSRLFNASLPPGDSRNRIGVPEGYKQLTGLDENARKLSTLPPEPMYSRSITNHGGKFCASVPILPAGLGFGFSYQKDSGAVLIINSEARGEDSLQLGAFEEYMREHNKSWLTFANSEPNFRRILQTDLFFVTGHDKTTDWAVAAFSQRSTSGGVQLQANVPGVLGVNFSTWGDWSGLTSPHLNSGPQRPRKSTELATTSGEVSHLDATERGGYDQCIFIRGFRIKYRLPGKLWPSLELVDRNRSAFRGLEDDESESDGESESDEVEKHPSVKLLDYILQQKPEASVAIVHDYDLAALINDENDSLDFDHILNEAAPPVIVDSEGIGAISFDGPATTAARDLTGDQDDPC